MAVARVRPTQLRAKRFADGKTPREQGIALPSSGIAGVIISALMRARGIVPVARAAGSPRRPISVIGAGAEEITHLEIWIAAQRRVPMQTVVGQALAPRAEVAEAPPRAEVAARAEVEEVAAREEAAAAADGVPISGLNMTSSFLAISTTVLASIISFITAATKPMSV